MFINKDDKKNMFVGRDVADVNVLRSMLVYCMLLDEHVKHEPQTILYNKHKLASGKYHIPNKMSVDLSLVLFHLMYMFAQFKSFLWPYFLFYVPVVHPPKHKIWF